MQKVARVEHILVRCASGMGVVAQLTLAKSVPSTFLDRLSLQEAERWGRPVTGTGRSLTELLEIISLIMGVG